MGLAQDVYFCQTTDLIHAGTTRHPSINKTAVYTVAFIYKMTVGWYFISCLPCTEWIKVTKWKLYHTRKSWNQKRGGEHPIPAFQM